MNLFEDTNPRALKELLAEIHNRSAVLPDFQRDFVWDPSATKELIVSIANNYPAGSILRVRDAKRVFAVREFEGAPVRAGATHTFLVLDGQQRLTSLYQAFYGVGEHRYYLDLGKLKVGQTIQIPAGAAAPAPAHSAKTEHAGAAADTASSATGETVSYTVKGGDSLTKIAKKFGVKFD